MVSLENPTKRPWIQVSHSWQATGPEGEKKQFIKLSLINHIRIVYNHKMAMFKKDFMQNGHELRPVSIKLFLDFLHSQFLTLPWLYHQRKKIPQTKTFNSFNEFCLWKCLWTYISFNIIVLEVRHNISAKPHKRYGGIFIFNDFLPLFFWQISQVIITIKHHNKCTRSSDIELPFTFTKLFI